MVVAAAELSHNAAGRAYTLAQLYRHLGHPVTLLGSHFPQWGRDLWEPICGAVQQQGLPVHSFVVEYEPGFVNQAWELVLQQPADLVHLSKPRLPAVVFLNNDCRVQHGWLEALLAPLADPAVAAVQPRLLKPNGTVQCLGVVFRQGQTLGYPLYAGLDGGLACCQQEHRLQALTGACLAVRSGDFAAVQGFDAGFLNSQEDVDLCLRLRAA